jgi:tRNA-2-methylthio-N6-dimethylallyladenosine synthase
VLEAMNRGYTVGQYVEFIDRARSFLDQPEINRPLTIAGDMIVGFCGETEADFEASKELLRRVRYKNCFIFKYSPRPGTVAFDRLPDDVPDETKKRRCNELLAVQHGISNEISRGLVGQELEVFVEGLSAREAKRRARSRGGLVSLTVGGAHGGAAETEADEPGGDRGPVQLTGRTDGDLIVVFDCPEGRSPDELIGRLAPVRIDAASVLTMFGTLAG